MKRPRTHVFLGVSLDGKIAGPGGDLGWLSIVDTEPPEDTGYEALFARVDALVIGRNSYDAASGFAEWPYAGKRVIVLTHRPLESRHGETAFSGALATLLGDLAHEGLREIYLDGGDLVRQAIAADLVDTLTISWLPIVLGRGVSLFDDSLPTSRWQLAAVRAFASGLAQARYLRRA